LLNRIASMLLQKFKHLVGKRTLSKGQGAQV
jgi:hypothetical protein